MRTLILLLLPVIFVYPAQNPSTVEQGSSVAVLSYKWSKSRQTIEKETAVDTGPAPAMTSNKRNYPRNARVNDPVGARDPDADTVDARSAAIEKSVQEARSAQPKTIDGYAYRARIQNAGQRLIEIIFWEYQFIDSANPETVTRRQFLCGVSIKPGKEKELQAFSVSGPSDVISVASLANKSDNPFQERVLINRVEYADGTIWQRKDWNFAEIRLGYKRAVGTPWGSEMCRGL